MKMHKLLTQNHGGVGFRIMISILTLTVLGFAIFMLLRTFESDKAQDFREAMRAAEEGLREAVEKLEDSPDWSTSFEDEPFEEGGSRYSVTFAHEERDGEKFLTVTSTGTSGSITQTMTLALRQLVDDDGTVRWAPQQGEVGTLGELVLDGDIVDADAPAATEVDDSADNNAEE